jgi:hypothetical protein
MEPMSSALRSVSIVEDQAIVSLENSQRLCKALMQMSHYAKMGEAGIFAIIQMAKSVGIDPLHALNGEMYNIGGKIGMGYEAMNKYIRQAGHSISFKELTDTKVTLVGRRKDNGDTCEVSFSIDDARRAGLVKSGGTYEKYPRSMLFARCLSMLKRFLFADILCRVYVKEELEAGIVENEDGTVGNLKEEQSNVVMEISPISDKISQDQASLLDDLIGENMEFRTKVMEYLKTKGVDSLADMPIPLYEGMVKRAKKEYEDKMQKIRDGELKAMEA